MAAQTRSTYFSGTMIDSVEIQRQLWVFDHDEFKGSAPFANLLHTEVTIRRTWLMSPCLHDTPVRNGMTKTHTRSNAMLKHTWKFAIKHLSTLYTTLTVNRQHYWYLNYNYAHGPFLLFLPKFG